MVTASARLKVPLAVSLAHAREGDSMEDRSLGCNFSMIVDLVQTILLIPRAITPIGTVPPT